MPELLPSPKLLRKILRYDSETGKLFWRARTIDMFQHAKVPEQVFKSWKTRFQGKEAFTAIRDGYRIGIINQKRLSAHRVAWAIYHGEWPSDEIDHINGNRSDNRIENLRAVSRAENTRNRKLRSDNKSGVHGVYFIASIGKWAARINVNKKERHLGTFETKVEAIKARKEAEESAGYHTNHGRLI